jgi:hypothetical protein
MAFGSHPIWKINENHPAMFETTNQSSFASLINDFKGYLDESPGHGFSKLPGPVGFLSLWVSQVVQLLPA